MSNQHSHQVGYNNSGLFTYGSDSEVMGSSETEEVFKCSDLYSLTEKTVNVLYMNHGVKASTT